MTTNTLDHVTQPESTDQATTAPQGRRSLKARIVSFLDNYPGFPYGTGSAAGIAYGYAAQRIDVSGTR